METKKVKKIAIAAAKERWKKRETLQAQRKKQRMSVPIRDVRRVSRTFSSHALEIIEGVVKKYDAKSTSSMELMDETLPPFPKEENPANASVWSGCFRDWGSNRKLENHHKDPLVRPPLWNSLRSASKIISKSVTFSNTKICMQKFSLNERVEGSRVQY